MTTERPIDGVRRRGGSIGGAGRGDSGSCWPPSGESMRFVGTRREALLAGRERNDASMSANELAAWAGDDCVSKGSLAEEDPGESKGKFEGGADTRDSRDVVAFSSGNWKVEGCRLRAAV